MPSRQKLLLGNWKMNHNYDQAYHYAQFLIAKMPNHPLTCQLGVAPSFIHLPLMRQWLQSCPVIIAAQDAHPCSHGPYTGSVSCQQLVDDQIHYVILGHSERRSQFQETDQVINAKIRAAIKCGLTVIFCFGETLTEYENNMTPMVLKNQVQNGLANLTFDMMKQVILAYEPVWAIGTRKTATANQAQSNIKLVRDLLADLFGAVVSEQTRILYGGSVNLANVVQLVYQPDIDGALVGGASLNPDDFWKMAQLVSQ